MMTATYAQYRTKLETYFDRTASKAWEQLTSDAPVSGIRATVRAGRTEMRDTLLSWLPAEMTGLRLLDAGCGTGALAVEAAQRGADVVAIDVAGSLVHIARDRAPEGLNIDWRVGDMLDPALGQFDHVVAMDSLIHYKAADIVAAVRQLGANTRGSIAFISASLWLSFMPSISASENWSAPTSRSMWMTTRFDPAAPIASTAAVFFSGR